MFKNRRWKIGTLLFCAGFINYLDRTAFSIAAPHIVEEFGLTPAELGYLFSSFFLGYACFNFIGGFLADKKGPRWVFTAAMTFWSVFCGLTGATFNFVSLFIVRVLFGIGEGPISVTISKTVNNWFPSKEKNSAIGFGNCGTPLGAAVAAPLMGLISIYLNWRIGFVVMALLGFVWAVIWWKTARDTPQEDSKVSPAELLEIQDGQMIKENNAVKVKEKIPLTYFLRQPTVLLTALAFFAYNYNLYFFLTWFPSYLIMSKGISLANMSFVTILPWVAGFIGLGGGGFVSDWLYRKTGKLMWSRKIILVVGLGITAVFIILVGFAETAMTAVLLMSIAIFMLYLTGSTYWAVIQNTVPSENLGSVSGFVHFLANLSGIIGPAVTGIIVQKTGVFTSAFVLAGTLAFLGAVMVALFVKPINTEKIQG